MNQFSFKNKKIDRILLIHPFGIGDALFVTPVIRTLKEQGVGRIDLLLGSRTRAVFEKNQNVHSIFEWDKSKPEDFKGRLKRFGCVCGLFFQVWKNRYQIVFDFSPTGQYAILSLFFFWIPIRAGFSFKQKGFFLTHKVDLPDGFASQSMVQYYLDLVRLFSIQPASDKTEFHLDQKDFVQAEKQLAELNIRSDLSLIAVAPGGGESWGKDSRLKRWPVSHFSALIRQLSEHKIGKAAVLILGSQNEAGLGEELARHLGNRFVFNLCGRASLGTVSALLKKSKVLIANDSGLVHLANALNVPVIAIFGPVDPNVYGPDPKNGKTISITNEGPACRPCYQRFRYQAQCVGVECLNHLTPEMVYDRIESAGFFISKPAVLK